MFEMLSGLFAGGGAGYQSLWQARVERKLDLILKSLGVALPEHPLSEEIGLLVQRGQKIEAIRVLRRATGCGLAEAKAAVDQGSWNELLVFSLRN